MRAPLASLNQGKGSMHDVIIAGAGPAGLSAALLLGRCLRRVLLCDGGPPRNSPAAAIHGYLTRDGVPPAEFLRAARRELDRYDTVEVRGGPVVGARRRDDHFEADVGDGRAEGRRLVLASTVSGTLWGAACFTAPTATAGRRAAGRSPPTARGMAGRHWPSP